MGAIALGVMSTNSEWNSGVLFKRLLYWAFILMGVSAFLAGIGIAG